MICASKYLFTFIRNPLKHIAEKILLLYQTIFEMGLPINKRCYFKLLFYQKCSIYFSFVYSRDFVFAI
jgi:hypothetical protein